MRRTAVVVLVVGVVCFMAGRVTKQAPASAQEGPCAYYNGDVDGTVQEYAGESPGAEARGIKITDAIYLLAWLFQGGEEPVPSCLESPYEACSVELARCTPPPATGQTLCYEESGAQIPCDSTTCPGQDGMYQTGCPSEGRFVDNGDFTVTDTCTGLMWQRATADVNGDGIRDDLDTLNWCSALEYCEELSFADYDDWRLPNVRELQSIVDYGRVGPAVDPVFGAASSGYWSSSSFALDQFYAWLVYFDDGHVNVNVHEVRHRFVRAVRTIQPGE